MKKLLLTLGCLVLIGCSHKISNPTSANYTPITNFVTITNIVYESYWFEDDYNNGGIYYFGGWPHKPVKHHWWNPPIHHRPFPMPRPPCFPTIDRFGCHSINLPHGRR